MRVVVPDYQLSLAIGKEGQNARLAARLTGCRIDIRSDAQADDEAATPSPGVGRAPLRSGPPGRFGRRGPAGRARPSSPTRGTSRPLHALECRVAETSIPVRTCVGCRKRAPVNELLRVVVRTGALVPDPRRRLPGGGPRCTPLRSACTQRSDAGPSSGRCASPEAAPRWRPVRSGTTCSVPPRRLPGARPGADENCSSQSDRHQAGPHVDRTPSDESAVKFPR